jgi:hypothetical protein
MANGIADIQPLLQFPMMVLNTSKCDRVIPEGMILGHALPHPRGIIVLTSRRPIRNVPTFTGRYGKRNWIWPICCRSSGKTFSNCRLNIARCGTVDWVGSMPRLTDFLTYLPNQLCSWGQDSALSTILGLTTCEGSGIHRDAAYAESRSSRTGEFYVCK